VKGLARSNAHVAPSIKKVDKFAVIIPFCSANENVPIPIDENQSGPNRRFYQDLLSLSGRPAKAPDGIQYDDRNFHDDAIRDRFISRLLQYYIFQSIDQLQRDGSLTSGP